MAVEPGPRGWFLEFLVFGFKQGWACLFGALMLALLLATHFLWPEDAPIHRYDALTMGAVLIQLSMLLFRLETPKEAVFLLIFYIVVTVMERPEERRVGKEWVRTCSTRCTQNP